ncbi:MAG: ATP-binding cassette domain-containing protein, partial [Chloroflexota bacterium]
EEGEARNMLARYLFTAEEVFKRVGDLSGGERSRVALAKLTLQPANLLLLDEPTNHLDINARQVLETVLHDYPGTLIMVSHDRYFITAAADTIWAVEDGVVRVYAGGYDDYLTLREQHRYQPEAVEPVAAEPTPHRRTARGRSAKPAAVQKTAPMERWEEPIAGLVRRVATLEREVRAATDSLTYVGARDVSTLLDLARARQARDAELHAATEALLEVFREELRRNPLHEGDQAQPVHGG